MMQLMMKTQQAIVDIGVLIPNGNMLEMRTRIAAKHIGDHAPTFFLQVRKGSGCQFYAVDPQAPFMHLEALGRAFFAIKNGQIGVEICPEKYKKKDEI